MKTALYTKLLSLGVCYDCLVDELRGSHIVPCAQHLQHVSRIMLLCVRCAGYFAVCFTRTTHSNSWYSSLERTAL